jgi:hypothetical protein
MPMVIITIGFFFGELVDGSMVMTVLRKGKGKRETNIQDAVP